MPDTDPTPPVGEIVSALSRFAPQSLADIKARHPGHDVLFRRGAVLGGTSISISGQSGEEVRDK